MTGQQKSEEQTQPAGSPGSGEPAFLVIGKLRRPHGLRGELLMDVHTDFPERIKRGVVVFAGPRRSALQVRSRRWAGPALLIAFEGYDSPEAAGELRNQWLYVRADDRPPLPEGEYYHHQLIGLRVVSEQGQELGELAEILETGANDVYLVRPESGSDVLIPAVAEFIRSIDLERGVMIIHVIPGLLSE
jgi:16S rRNA processing protein RimM